MGQFTSMTVLPIPNRKKMSLSSEVETRLNSFDCLFPSTIRTWMSLLLGILSHFGEDRLPKSSQWSSKGEV